MPLMTDRRSGPHWHDDAACRDADPSLFDITEADAAIAGEVVDQFCDGCPVKDDCFTWANGSDFEGIAAGFVWKGHRHKRTRPGAFTEEQILAAHYRYTHHGDRSDRTRAGERAYQRLRKRRQRAAGNQTPEEVQAAAEAALAQIEREELAVTDRRRDLLATVDREQRKKNGAA